MKLQLTITNPHVEAWLNSRVKLTGNTMQVVLRDLAYTAMILAKRKNIEVLDNEDEETLLRGMPENWGERKGSRND